MAQDKLSGRRISKLYDRDAIPGTKFDTATQIGIVKDNLSPARDGRLRVWIPDFGGEETDPKFWRTVNYAAPYTGSTYQPQNSKNNSYAETQHSYGMWMTPPDPGTTVMVFFIEGYISQGFWFGCVTDRFANQMIPGIGSIPVSPTALTSCYVMLVKPVGTLLPALCKFLKLVSLRS